MSQDKKNKINIDEDCVKSLIHLKVEQIVNAEKAVVDCSKPLHERLYEVGKKTMDEALLSYLDCSEALQLYGDAKMFYSRDIMKFPAKPDGVMTLLEVYKMARTDKQLKQMISRLRALRVVDINQYKEEKKKLPYIVPGGEFKVRSGDGLIRPSGMASMDFDGLDIAPHELLDKLKRDPYINVLFGAESPSGVGLKVIIAYDFMNCPFLFEDGNSIPDAYRKGYVALENYIEYKYGYKLDKACKDISRAMFLVSDEKAYINPLLIGEEPNEFNLIEREVFDFKYWYNYGTNAATIISGNELIFDSNIESVIVDRTIMSNVTDGSICADSDNDASKVEVAIAYLEAHNEYMYCTDDRDEWIMLGMSLVSMFEEQGRGYYHRLSRLSNKYDVTECNSKYDELLRNSKRIVKSGSFFKWFKDLTGKKVVYMSVEDKGICLTDKCFDRLTKDLKAFVGRGEKSQEKDLYLIGAIDVFGAMFDKVKFYHKDSWVYPNFYTMIVGESASGKSAMKYVRMLFEKYNDECRKTYEAALIDYRARAKGKKNFTELPPIQESFIMAGDINSPTMCDFLDVNKGRGVIIETEAMSMLTKINMKNDSYGSLMKNLLLAYANEPISYMRKKDNLSVEVKTPKLGILISGTPNWISSIARHRDSGLLSRFWFLSMDDEELEFEFSTKPKSGDKSAGIVELQDKVCELANFLGRRKEDLIVEYSEDQNDRFDIFFNDIVKKYGKDMKDIILRCALNSHKCMTIFSVLRRYEAKDVDLTRCESITISEDDFELGLRIGEYMLDSTLDVIAKYSEKDDMKEGKGVLNKFKFLECLPENSIFTRSVAVERGKNVMGWESAWVDKMLKELKNEGKLSVPSKGRYVRVKSNN